MMTDHMRVPQRAPPSAELNYALHCIVKSAIMTTTRSNCPNHKIKVKKLGKICELLDKYIAFDSRGNLLLRRNSGLVQENKSLHERLRIKERKLKSLREQMTALSRSEKRLRSISVTSGSRSRSYFSSPFHLQDPLSKERKQIEAGARSRD